MSVKLTAGQKERYYPFNVVPSFPITPIVNVFIPFTDYRITSSIVFTLFGILFTDGLLFITLTLSSFNLGV